MSEDNGKLQSSQDCIMDEENLDNSYGKSSSKNDMENDIESSAEKNLSVDNQSMSKQGNTRSIQEIKSKEKVKRRRIKKFTMSKKKNLNSDKNFEAKEKTFSSSIKRKTLEPQIYDYFHDNFAKSKLKQEFISGKDWDKMINSKDDFLKINKYDIRLTKIS